jgi:hypothetical protein
MRTLVDFEFDGQAALGGLLAESGYRSLLQAVASLSVFARPATVKQTNNRGVFAIVRANSPTERCQTTELPSGRLVMLDDNKGPTDTFVGAHGWKRGGYKDVQFNHLWPISDDPEHYTSLANLCVLPAFLSKLSDTHPETQELLRYRAYDLYGYWPGPGANSQPPADYAKVLWSDPLPVVENLEQTYLGAMRRKPRDRTTLSVLEIGWLFSNFVPVPALQPS